MNKLNLDTLCKELKEIPLTIQKKTKGGYDPSLSMSGPTVEVFPESFDYSAWENTWNDMGGSQGSGEASLSTDGGGYNGYVENYVNDWSKLTAQEKIFVTIHPVQAQSFFDNAAIAHAEVSRFPGGHNGQQDAMRHALWCALNVVSEGSYYAQEFGNAHEANDTQPIEETNMDLHNNNIGYYVGHLATQGEWSYERIVKEVENYWDAGLLRTLHEGTGSPIGNAGPLRP